ncbi:fimbrial protein [Vibrio sagamiensis]|uniref:Major fimbrial subunit PmfA n=1 Tax=Vibrio sagamiensis NBRC 104589 TaxID=1219064 RepID=A0A511QFZ3_9VIBR|nr:fimbrial protein [Vibrio sagamiensis]GEM76228.1 major fimbrial subunit PmfA [Vibrio sagamiensis NBRC 104589]
MKAQFNRTILSASLLLSAFSVSTLADTVEAEKMQKNETLVNFQGELVESACGLSPNSEDQTIKLGQQPTHLFVKKGDNSPQVSFNIKLIECNTTVAKKATFTFLSNQDITGDLFNVEGGATGIGVRIFHNGKKIKNGQVAATNKLSNGNNIASFSAAYERNIEEGGSDIVTAGVANSRALLQVGYL